MSKIQIMQEPDENKIPFLVYLSLVLHFKKCSLFLPVWSSTLISKNNDFFFQHVDKYSILTNKIIQSFLYYQN